MKICLLVIGKTDADYIRAGIEEYEKRLRKYVGYEMKVLPDVKNTKHMSETLQKEKEGLLLLEQFLPTDYVILLDERRIFCFFGTKDAEWDKAVGFCDRRTLWFFGSGLPKG